MLRPAESPQARNRSSKQNPANGPARSGKPRARRRRSFIFPILMIVMGCVVFLFAAWSAVTSPVLASFLNAESNPIARATPLQSFAQVILAKPTYTPQALAQSDVLAAASASSSMPAQAMAVVHPTQADQPTSAVILPTDTAIADAVLIPTDTPVVAAVAQPTDTSDATATDIAQAIETPGIAFAQIVADTPTSEISAPTSAPSSSPSVATYAGEHWIDVNLSQQRVYAYAGDTIVNSFIVSTGTWQYPTVTGKFHVWIKLLYSDMSGPGYYLPDVPYVMYFYKGYGLHGTYWHHNFGVPMSHGCVNLSIPDAQWLYNFSVVGTLVNVHY